MQDFRRKYYLMGTTKLKLKYPKEEKKRSWTYLNFFCSCISEQKSTKNNERKMDEEDPDLDFENSGHLCGSPLAPFAPFVFTPLILLY